MSESTAYDDRRKWFRERLKRRIVRLFSAGLVGGQPQADYLASLGVPPARVFKGYDVVDNKYFADHAEAARKRGATIWAFQNIIFWPRPGLWRRKICRVF
jgi:1,2-diacylglycerol 3-alpha-glucosyltransferase